MKWKKIGNLFCPTVINKWMYSHASNVVAESLNGDIVRVYFTTRNISNKSSIGAVDIDFKRNFKIVNLTREPILSFGEKGLFDDSGVTLSCIVNFSGKKYLYYMGWNLGVTVPWRNSIGLAICDKIKGNFTKYSQSPIMDRNAFDPYTLSYPYVLKEKNLFRMWYGSNLRWGKRHKDMYHVIKYAESKDGINWTRNEKAVIKSVSPKEYAFSRPFVLNDNGLYKMWYSYRGRFYRIGYAESRDGINWKRKDKEVGLNVSKEGWDNEMICYPFVFDYKGERYLFYNGNGYGKTGFGVAILEKE
ncbi:MAG: hypothetical protein WC358_08395 [Ignavibacteria bacterium]|jgi:hypothetical protein